MKKKRSFSLMEIMLVILIISLVGSVIGYSMKGSLEEGKAFRTQQAISKLYELVQMRIAEAGDIDFEKIGEEIEKTGLVKKASDLLKDGWGAFFTISKDEEEGDIRIYSDNLTKYIEKKGKKRVDYYPWEKENE